MLPKQIPISEGGRIILNTVKDELFPILEELKVLLVETQECRISYQLYSKTLNELDTRYSTASSKFFAVTRKLETPDIILKGLSENPQNIADYFQYQTVIKANISQGMSYVEIVDRTLDRKMQAIQNNRTFLVSISAIIISIIGIWAQ